MPKHPLLAVQHLMPQPGLPERLRTPAACFLEVESVVHAMRTTLLRDHDRAVEDINQGIEHAISKLVAARFSLNDNAAPAPFRAENDR